MIPEDLKDFHPSKGAGAGWADLLVIPALLLCIAGTKAVEAYTEAHLLETSGQPATLDECQRARPDLPRPTATISHQHRTNEPWQRRTCIYTTERTPAK